MIVAGGSYLEICLRPDWRRLFGSGLRAACAISRLSPGTELYTYCFGDWADDIRHTAAAFGCLANVEPVDEAISFSYDHPLSAARLYPPIIARRPPLVVRGRTVLRFGFVEGEAVVEAERAVFDPQSHDPFEPFGANGSRAGCLALVLNETEAGAASPGFDAEVLMGEQGAAVLVVKRGPRGATVYEVGTDPIDIPAYRSEGVFKIGSGDVFSAAFALHWGERGMDAAAAADLASKSVAHFVDGHSLPLDETLRHGEAMACRLDDGPIYLAGPFFDLSQRWMVEEVYRTLTDFGARIFSPLHEVGTGLPVEAIAQADLAGLRGSSKMLALLDGADPGTVFEVGYARALDIPVVALAERLERENLTMIAGSGCDVTHDLATAIYRVMWTKGR
ncbi:MULTISPECIES: nucleoside 2-deoxyribosyltransferase [unclassified Bradyrhizobium]|uniref:nucleoside 2-deoxyribosyltransferase n=1 Tax=unclassified Bradyrhizobium TaxID=2631580 RepID=UPI0028E5E6FE|nr:MULTISPECIES: PfkB family carbohydrate kinase [unclassified Bradyrhizobium]